MFREYYFHYGHNRLLSSIMKLLTVLFILPILTGCPAGNGGITVPVDAIGGPLAENPQIQSDGQGNYMAVWEAGVSIYSRYYRNGNGEDVFRVAYGEHPRFAMDGSDMTHIVWQEQDNDGRYSVHERRYSASSNAWSDQGNLLTLNSPNIFHHILPAVDAYGDHAIVAVQQWLGGDDADRLLKTAEYLDIADDNLPSQPLWWDIRYTLVNESNQQAQITPAKVAIGAERRAMVAWLDSSQQSEGLHVAKYAPGPNGRLAISNWDEQWKFNPSLAASGDSETDFDIAMQPNGDTLVVWVEGNAIFANRYIESAGVWQGAIALGTVATGTSPAFAMNDDGWAVIAYNRGNALYARVLDPSIEWNSAWYPQQSINNNQPMQGNPHAAISNDRQAMVTWEQDAGIYTNLLSNGVWGTSQMVGSGHKPQVALEDNARCIVIWEDEGFIHDYNCNAPEALFSYAPQSPQPGAQVMFDASDSVDDVGSIVSYEWDFDNDGTFDASGVTASYTFVNEGAHTVVLRVTNDHGGSSEISSVINVSSSLALSVGIFGSGSVNSSDGLIDCGPDCGETYPLGTQVALTATAASGWRFSNWSGDCAIGSDTSNPVLSFTVTANINLSCTATFSQIPTNEVSLALIVIGNGEALREGQTQDLLCSNMDNLGQSTCVLSFQSGTILNMSGISFGTGTPSWSGCDNGNGFLTEPCKVTLTNSREVVLHFIETS